jgi:secretion/DNA translocation related TadE-like protein
VTTAGARRGARGDDGVAAVLVLCVASLLVLAALVFASVAAVAVARQRAASAADLSALAAAQAALEGPAVACARARALAQRVAATVTSCRLDGDVAEVVAEVRPPGRLGELGAARSRARAGPANRLAGGSATG